ncbi:MAG: 3-oxoadipate enol-lactonase [Xanthobacteraceae bacterium]|nr:3-oxoadipate enol-lactonase [Xanthobacteraceae bacterium]
MPVIDANGCKLHVEVVGRDSAPVLMLSNSLGTTLHMWDEQVKPFTDHFRLVRYDRRGHGKSALAPGPYTMEMLGRDALAIMDGLGVEKVNWCGLSMGGMVGMWLGANAPERIDKLILSNTAAWYADKGPWNTRIEAVRKGGLAAIGDMVMNVWFTKDFREREAAKVDALKQMLLATPLDGYVACCEAVRDMDHRELLARIQAPTMVIAGRHDPATNIEAAEFVRSRIPGASLTVLDAAHISNVEQPYDYADRVIGFLTQRRG